ncbi:uncharacterized protein LOC109511270 isoform X4 [Hippocampus comes]|uniref:uncharacterized protein LOC109511270 isoform X4 n=1 Tax=Hippocampus comes TaxID=109280 RepID=UPI00094EA395|nr:PREDICTED: uncharacterized protein LOC109511270 isoform X4 [Hippocampus comes]
METSAHTHARRRDHNTPLPASFDSDMKEEAVSSASRIPSSDNDEDRFCPSSFVALGRRRRRRRRRRREAQVSRTPAQHRRQYESECVLRPLDARTASSPQTCSLIFGKDSIFQSHHVLRVWINCSKVAMTYQPACHVKLPAPGKPEINQTTVSWAAAKQDSMSLYNFQLEWKQADEPWDGASVHREKKSCKESCRSNLSLDQLSRGTAYEARLRVRASEDDGVASVWSDWSAAARWTSDVGEAAAPPADSLWLVLGVTISGTAFAVFLTLLLFRKDKINWVYVFKKIRGPRLPDPGKSSLQNKWPRPPFSSESLQVFLRPVDVLAVMPVGCVETVSLGDPRYPRDPGAVLEKMMRKITTVGLFPPASSQLRPPPFPVASLTSGNLKLCAPESPYGTVGAIADQDGEMTDARKLFLEVIGGVGDKATPVISDYEKIEKLQGERSKDDDESGGQCGGAGRSPLEGVLIKGSVQVSLDYECIRTRHHHDSPELPGADSGVGGVREEHAGPEVSLEDGEEKASCLPCPPGPAGPCGCAPPLDFHRPTLESLQALLLDATDFTRGAVEPSSGGYMSVCQRDPETG